MSGIIAIKFRTREQASDALLRVHRWDATGSTLLSAIAISFERGTATVREVIDPISLSGYRWPYFWLGLFRAAQMDLLIDNFPDVVKLWETTPAVFIDHDWWTTVLGIRLDFLIDLQVLFQAANCSVLLGLWSGSLPTDDVVQSLGPETTIHEDISPEHIRLLEKIVHLNDHTWQ